MISKSESKSHKNTGICYSNRNRTMIRMGKQMRLLDSRGMAQQNILIPRVLKYLLLQILQRRRRLLPEGMYIEQNPYVLVEDHVSSIIIYG